MGDRIEGGTGGLVVWIGSVRPIVWSSMCRFDVKRFHGIWSSRWSYMVIKKGHIVWPTSLCDIALKACYGS